MQRALPVSFVLAITGCGGGGGDDGSDDAPDGGVSAACMLATTYQELTPIRENIFKRSCAFMDCHDAVGPEGEMDLTGAGAHAALVNVPVTSLVAPGWIRVVPGNPQQSYLMVMLGRYPGPIDDNVGPMPQNSPPLCTEKIDAIERWIVAGAMDN